MKILFSSFIILLLSSVNCFKIEEPDIDVEMTLFISMNAIFCSEKARLQKNKKITRIDENSIFIKMLCLN